MFRRIKERIKRDDGNATVLLGIMLIICLIMIGGMMLDFSKAQHLKSSYVDAAKKATQAATMEVNSRGYLKAESVGVAIATYEAVMRPSIINTEGYFSKCENYDEDDINLEVYLIDGEAIKPFTISREKVVDILESMYGEGFNYNNVNKDTLADRINSELRTDGSSNVVNSGFRPTEIQLKVTEGTENSVLPVGFKLTGESDNGGMKCQKLKIAAKATKFLGDTDNRYD